MSAKLAPQRILDLLATTFGFGARLAHDFAGGSERELEVHRLLDAAADHHRPVDGREFRVFESGRLELCTNDFRTGHRKRTGTAGLSVFSGRRQEIENDLLRNAD